MADSSIAESAPLLTIDGPVATIRLARPSKHNRIEPDDVAIFRAQLAEVAAHADIGCLVITGTGAESFCSGYSIAAIAERLDSSFEDLLDAVENMNIGVIAALNGSLYGGATDLALCCDFRIGVAGSRMAMPAIKFGLHFYPGGIRRFATQLGLPVAKRIFLSGLPLEADEMLRVGYLTELVERNDFDASVARYVDAILAMEPTVFAEMKSHLRAASESRLDETAARTAYLTSVKSKALAERVGQLTIKKARDQK